MDLATKKTQTPRCSLPKQPAKTASLFRQVPLNTEEIPQCRLDLANRTRTNPFPWRGQFSPELVELLLTHYASRQSRLLDPYVGVGTTIFEAGRKQLQAVGVEINPAAVAMAQTSLFIPYTEAQRRRVIMKARDRLDGLVQEGMPLFRKSHHGSRSVVPELAELLQNNRLEPALENILTNVLIRLVDQPSQDEETVFRAFEQHCGILLNLPHSQADYRVINADARNCGIDSDSIDLVITSPPYINVFNYHQNNRKAMELIQWDLLTVAQSEIGSNRKNRGNRFLTVIQYCLDMAMALRELKRIVTSQGRIIIVVGRESNVRGVAFQNGSILTSLAHLRGFSLPFRQERKFVSRFGGTIYEDILHLTPEKTRATAEDTAIREIAIENLEAALAHTPDKTLQKDIRSAIDRADSIQPSPIYKPQDARTAL